MKQISLQGVSIHFGSLTALTEVDLALSPGQVTLLAGPNGAGKSTILRVLLGLLPSKSGTILVDGSPITVGKRFKARLGYLPEAVAFAETLTGRQVLRFIASARGLPRSRVEAILDQVGLSAAAARAIRGYSRGMRQRLGLGVAILSEPELLILDEPTGGLDQEGLTLLWSVLREWKAAHRFVILSSHDLALLESRVDRVCLLDEGTVRAEGTPAELRALAQVPVTVFLTLSEDGARVDALVDALQRWPRASLLGTEAGVLALEIEPDALLPLLDLHSHHTEAVQGIRVSEPAFDTIYDHLLTGGARHGKGR